VSGGGTNLQALLKAQTENKLKSGEIVLVVSTCEKAYALQRASQANVKTAVLRPKECADINEYGHRLVTLLESEKTDLVVLAGYLTILPKSVTTRFANRIINVHPSLIPAFCGAGYYGIRVHREALARGVKITGATVHLVDDEVDGGKILLQKAVEVLEDDTPETLQMRVMREAEWVLLPQAVAELCELIEKGESII
jgi:phosphoribosylglycinamide formyltransferase-1